jgi:hypothetical protein
MKMKNLFCIVCCQPIEPHTSIIAGIEREGVLRFRWACEHNPVGDAAVILGSNDCAAEFVLEHPEYYEQIDRLLAKQEC